MTRLRTIPVLLATGALALTGCGGGGEQAATTSTAPQSSTVQPSGETPGTEQGPGTASVSMRNIKFTPATVRVKTGESVRWLNDDAVAHTATAQGGQFDSGNMEPGATYQYKPTQPGTIRYLCSIHGAQQSGTIEVSGG